MESPVNPFHKNRHEEEFMKKMYQKMRQNMLIVCLCCLGIFLCSGCAIPQMPWQGTPYTETPRPATPPTLSNLTISPNPTCAGNIVRLFTTYVDQGSDLQSGMAAVSVNGTVLSPISFRATSPSGVLEIPMPVNYYTRPSDVQILLRIRDAGGNWSNTVSAVLSIR